MSLRAKQSLGQNFLMHAQIAERIVAASGCSENDRVLEIGPGTGMLTRALLERAGHVIAIETDTELIPGLEEAFQQELANGKLKIIPGDVRSFDPARIAGEYHLVANIPYYLTGEIIRSFLSTSHKPEKMTLLVQKEVAVRIAREKKGSLLQMAVRAYGVPAYAFTVPAGAFRPAPKVDSAVLTISDIDSSAFTSQAAEERFFEILHAGFAHKRKLLIKNLEVVASREVLSTLFTQLKLSPTTRAEELSIDTWRDLTERLG